LAFDVRALLHETAGFVDESIPDIDISDAGLGGGLAIQRIQKQHIGHRRMAAPTNPAT
jgi:hypothetical protein